MIIEVLASAVVLLIVSAGIFSLVQATAHSSSENRHRSEAYSISQEDQARMRSMRLSSLNALDQTRTVTLNGTKFTIRSTGAFVNDRTGTTSCATPETSTADYVKISSEVTWPKMQSAEAARIQSIVSPSKSLSIDPKTGTISITARNAKGEPLPGLRLSGSGAATFNGETNELGCAMFTNLPAPNNFTMVPSGTNLVDKDGLPPAAMTVSAAVGPPTPYSVEYDHPGTIPVSFETLSEGKLVPAKADTVFAFNTGMSTARTFSTVGLVRELAVNASPLYPFPSPYSIYAGACAVNNPNPEGKTSAPGAAGVANVAVAPGGTAPAKVQLPALDLTVNNVSTPIKGAKVTITDLKCKDAKGVNIKRTYTTNAAGKQTVTPAIAPEATEPGLPYSEYKVCASAKIGSTVRLKEATVTVQSLTVPKVLILDLSAGTKAECL